jgi:hypothetical protein
MLLSDFLARQLAAHTIGIRCNPTVYESSASPSNVFHDDAASAR